MLRLTDMEPLSAEHLKKLRVTEVVYSTVFLQIKRHLIPGLGSSKRFLFLTGPLASLLLPCR